MSKHHTRLSIAAGVTAAVVAIAVTALAASGSLSTPFAGKPSATQSGSVSATLTHDFAVFTRRIPHSHAATFGGATARVAQLSASQVPVPPNVVAHLQSPYSLSLGQAQYLSTSALPHVGMWIIPGASGECLVSQGVVDPDVADSVCAPASVAAAGRLVKYSWAPDGTPEFIGLAPNGVSSVSVTDASGSVHSVPVQDNVYTVVGGNPSKLDLKGTGGTTSAEVTPPAQSYVPPPATP